jgi:hypothetical protein
MPGAPLLALTRLYAAAMLSFSTTFSISWVCVWRKLSFVATMIAATFWVGAGCLDPTFCFFFACETQRFSSTCIMFGPSAPGRVGLLCRLLTSAYLSIPVTGDVVLVGQIDTSYPTRPPPMRFLFVRPEFCLRLPSDSTSRWTPLPSG